jgi:hypothetical protein
VGEGRHGRAQVDTDHPTTVVGDGPTDLPRPAPQLQDRVPDGAGEGRQPLPVPGLPASSSTKVAS